MAKKISRRTFIKSGAIALGSVAALNIKGMGSAIAAPPNRAKVFFTPDISANGLLKIYGNINQTITGRTGIKIHTGEPHGPNIIPRDMVKALQQQIPNSNLVETNTYYVGKRSTTADHREILKTNGWDFCPVDILDEDGAVMIPVKGGRHSTGGRQ